MTKEEQMTHLPINLKVVERTDDVVTVATESGHMFRMPAGTAPEDAFTLDPLEMSNDVLDASRPAMSRAILNEIIGAPTTAAHINQCNEGR